MNCRQILQLLIALHLTAVSVATAAETEGCLNCHQYQGLSRVDATGKAIADFFVDPRYAMDELGPHARLRCTDCHTRSEVEVFPHEKVSPVDCMRSCHLSGSTGSETRFSHDSVSHLLAGSVHKQETLEKSNMLLGNPLSAKQSRCLLCHDEPFFRKVEGSMAEDTSFQRCSTCHGASLPMGSRFDLLHVHARTMPSRSSGETVRICATCHSNPAIKTEFKLPDATASFLASYHGKAVELGSDATADCLHCHAGLATNVHKMLKADDAAAPTSKLHAPDTCRVSGCHGTSGASFSAAAVHFDLGGDAHGIEFFIALMFLAIILFTFGPSLLLTALKLFHHVIGKHDPEHHRHWHLAETLLAKSHTREKLIRFQAHQRFQHWLLAVSFTLLCLTGFPMKFANHAWAASMVNLFGGLGNARIVHRTAAVFLIAGFLYHVIYILRVIRQESKASGKGFLQALKEMPMAISPKDALEMHQLMLYYSFAKKTKPTAGKFGPEEKFEYVGVFWGTFVLGTTGILLWANAWMSRYLPGRVFTIATLMHTFEAFLALLHIGIVHITHVILSPTVFPLSKAMITGHTPKKKLVKGHGGLLKKLAAEHGLDDVKEVPHG